MVFADGCDNWCSTGDRSQTWRRKYKYQITSCLEKHCCEGVQRNQEKMKEAVESERMGERHG